MTYPPYGGPYPDSGQPQGQPPQQPQSGFVPQGQPPQHPGWQPPPGQPMQPGFAPQQRNRTGLILGLCGGGFGVVVLVVILILTLGGSSPSSVADRFIAASMAGDLDALQSVICRADQEEFDSLSPSEQELLAEMVIESLDGREYEILGEVIDGNEAVVTVKVFDSDGVTTEELTLVNEDGWKVCTR